jgi:hypothetical protein
MTRFLLYFGTDPKDSANGMVLSMRLSTTVFPNQRSVEPSQNIGRSSARNNGINKQTFWNTAKFCRNFCREFGNAGVGLSSIRYQQPLCFVFVISYLRLYWIAQFVFFSYCHRDVSPVAAAILLSINCFWPVNLFVGRGSSGCEYYIGSSSMGKVVGNTGLKGKGDRITEGTLSPCDPSSDQYSNRSFQ